MTVSRLERWLDSQLENEEVAAWYHILLGVLALGGVVYHILWAARRHRNHQQGLQDPHQTPWLRRHE